MTGGRRSQTGIEAGRITAGFRDRAYDLLLMLGTRELT